MKLTAHRHRFLDKEELHFHARYRNRQAASREETRRIERPQERRSDAADLLALLLLPGGRS